MRDVCRGLEWGEQRGVEERRRGLSPSRSSFRLLEAGGNRLTAGLVLKGVIAWRLLARRAVRDGETLAGKHSLTLYRSVPCGTVCRAVPCSRRRGMCLSGKSVAAVDTTVFSICGVGDRIQKERSKLSLQPLGGCVPTVAVHSPKRVYPL